MAIHAVFQPCLMCDGLPELMNLPLFSIFLPLRMVLNLYNCLNRLNSIHLTPDGPISKEKIYTKTYQIIEIVTFYPFLTIITPLKGVIIDFKKLNYLFSCLCFFRSF